MTTDTLLVTGASGTLGRLVLDQLLERGATATSIIATTRRPDTLAGYAARGVQVRRADFDQPQTLANAFGGAGRALLISTDALAQPSQRVQQHADAIAAMQSAGVQHVIYTSLTTPLPSSKMSAAADHWATEQTLLASGLRYTILRNNLYSDLLLPALADALKQRQWITARGDGAAAT